MHIDVTETFHNIVDWLNNLHCVFFYNFWCNQICFHFLRSFELIITSFIVTLILAFNQKWYYFSNVNWIFGKSQLITVYRLLTAWARCFRPRFVLHSKPNYIFNKKKTFFPVKMSFVYSYLTTLKLAHAKSVCLQINLLTSTHAFALFLWKYNFYRLYWLNGTKNTKVACYLHLFLSSHWNVCVFFLSCLSCVLQFKRNSIWIKWLFYNTYYFSFKMYLKMIFYFISSISLFCHRISLLILS